MATEQKYALKIPLSDITPVLEDISYMSEAPAEEAAEEGDISIEEINENLSAAIGSFSGAETYPMIIPNSPRFKVPANPLLPPEYNEILDYNAIQYQNGFFRTQIGRYVKVEQLVGSNSIEEYYGFLIGVGINYIVLQDYDSDNIRVLDIYGIKNMYVYYSDIYIAGAGSSQSERE
ncbi:MAG TPA: hypothetical protein IAC50_02975 [Candidatus Copromorpha excrementigallinarum]|uniref:Uncharacterized protein n=1 Tax=Candidatus Allocopromorpha excrementigallinarum TaxID=2840742 RepID=A0A9D1L6X5_9FIRM|nr:hypothetical protein [Candidatus Copromorpha excrementigallinarum]